jgi:general secretion pathway protein B
MSFILDALKKSEAERQQQDAPGIASIPQGSRPKPSSKWIWLVFAVLAVNLAVLGGLMLKVQQETPLVELPVTSSEPDLLESPTASSPSPEPETRQIPADVTSIEAVTTQPAAPVSTPVVASVEAATSINEGLETFNDLRAKGVLVLPDMHLDIHVYGQQATERFVFVNMSKYKENATLAEGPVVSAITPDGVVLNYQGISFLLPRE